MRRLDRFLSPSDAARRLGISTKALRLYEQRGLISPGRTSAGWRSYGPDEMARAADIVSLRSLGFSLAQIARLLDGDTRGLEDALTAHEATLNGRLHQLADTLEKVRLLRAELAKGKAPGTRELVQRLVPSRRPAAVFDLPWPWGGERFELPEIRSVNYIVGPLFSGKTRLARKLSEELPNAAYLCLKRLDSKCADPHARLSANRDLEVRTDLSMKWLVEDGATPSDALLMLVVELEADGPGFLIIDMIEQGLDEATQFALAAHLRRRPAGARPLFILTRSSAILDLEAIDNNQAILYCPPNHSPPFAVSPYPGTRGYEAVATCLAPPDVRARAHGVVAVRQPAA